jgi:hypothetical protein
MPRLSLHMERNIRWDLNDAKLPKSFKRHSKTIYKAFTPLHSISFYVNIDHVSLGKQSIANKYAPINTQNIGLIRENVELNSLCILMYLFILHWTCSVQQNWKIDHTVIYANSGYFIIAYKYQLISNHDSGSNKCSAEYNTQQEISEDSAFLVDM